MLTLVMLAMDFLQALVDQIEREREGERGKERERERDRKKERKKERDLISKQNDICNNFISLPHVCHQLLCKLEKIRFFVTVEVYLNDPEASYMLPLLKGFNS